MTDERGDDTGGGADGDGLDAWLAAHFPAQPQEPKPEEPKPLPQEPLPVTPPPLVEPPAAPPIVPPIVPPTMPPFGQSPPVAPPDPQSPIAPPVHPQEPPALPPVDAALPGAPSEPSVPADPTEAFGAATEASALDSLFGETKFRDYEAEPGTSQNPFVKPPVISAESGSAVGSGSETPVAASRPPREGIPTTQKTLMWIAGSLIAVLVFGALFLAGTKLSNLLGPAPAVIETPTSTPTPTPTALPIGPVEPGDYHWDELLGGECLDPYDGPWEDDYTVIDCVDPHPAQLVTRGVFGPDDDFLTPFPGLEALHSQVNLLCTASTAINYAAAGAYNDIQFEASYAATQQEWVDGNRDYYCFVTRASGEPLTGSIAVPPVAPAPVAPPVP